MKRITCITLFNENSIDNIKNVVNCTSEKLCKVPYSEINREKVDLLPYHITLQSWNENEKKEAIKVFDSIIIDKIKLIVKGISIKKGKDEAYNLYLQINENKKLESIYKQLYKITQNQKYNPETYMPHITIHTDRDYDKILYIKRKLERDFREFEIEFEKIGLFEIYPIIKIK